MGSVFMPLLQDLWKRRWIRFLMMGGINTGFSYGSYALLVYCGVNFAVSNLVALVLGILFSFKTQGAFVFGVPGNGVFGRFIIVWCVIYVINIAMIGGMIKLGLSPYVAGALAIFPVAVLSYLFQRYFVFTGVARA
jgi:putative flippase GtrA